MFDLLIIFALAKMQEHFSYKSKTWQWVMLWLILMLIADYIIVYVWAKFPVPFQLYLLVELLMSVYIFGYFALLRKYKHKIGVWWTLYCGWHDGNRIKNKLIRWHRILCIRASAA